MPGPGGTRAKPAPFSNTAWKIPQRHTFLRQQNCRPKHRVSPESGGSAGRWEFALKKRARRIDWIVTRCAVIGDTQMVSGESLPDEENPDERTWPVRIFSRHGNRKWRKQSELPQNSAGPPALKSFALNAVENLRPCRVVGGVGVGEVRVDSGCVDQCLRRSRLFCGERLRGSECCAGREPCEAQQSEEEGFVNNSLGRNRVKAWPKPGWLGLLQI